MVKISKNLIMYILLFAFLVTQSFATSQEKGSITIDYTYQNQNIKNASYVAYLVKSIDEQGNYQNTDKFSDFEDFNMEDLNYDNIEEYQQILGNIENFISVKNIAYDKVVRTSNDDGLYIFEDLELGLYYLSCKSVTQNGKEYTSEPLLVLVEGEENSSGDMVFDYKAKPKISVVEKPNNNTGNNTGSYDSDDDDDDENEDDEYEENEEEKEDNQELTSIFVEKEWKGTSSDREIPQYIEVELYKDGKLYSVVVLDDSNLWKHTWRNLDKNAVWGVLEKTILDDFDTTYKRDGFDFIITNTYKESEEENDLELDLETDGDRIPETGSFASQVPVFISIGLIFILLGILLKRSDDKC